MEFVTDYGQNNNITTTTSLDTPVSFQSVGALSSNLKNISKRKYTMKKMRSTQEDLCKEVGIFWNSDNSKTKR